jgi:hypothetical protein
MILVLGGLLVNPSHAAAWSAKGHRIIARLAWQQLGDDTKLKVTKLLGSGVKGDDPLTSVASWADEQALKNPKTRAWHFVEIPLNENYAADRDCRNNDCLIAVLERLKNQLQFGKSRQERIDALKYLVHLIGDLHQPLHCSDNNDDGGKKTQVTFFGRLTNLQAVWDSGMIDRTGLDEVGYVKALQRALPPEGYWIEDWAAESHALAKSAYQIPPDRALGNAYYKLNLPIVDRQLARAAVRLDQILSDVLR